MATPKQRSQHRHQEEINNMLRHIQAMGGWVTMSYRAVHRARIVDMLIELGHLERVEVKAPAATPRHVYQLTAQGAAAAAALPPPMREGIRP